MDEGSAQGEDATEGRTAVMKDQLRIIVMHTDRFGYSIVARLEGSNTEGIGLTVIEAVADLFTARPAAEALNAFMKDRPKAKTGEVPA